VLRAEIELNLDAVEVFQRRVRYLRDRIMAGQVSEDDLFVSASNFDYSVVSPLVNLGYFHMLLGPDYVKKYFRFMQFFNNSSAQQMNSDLRLKHAEGKSIDLLDMLLGISENLSQGLAEIHAAKLDWWGLRLKPVKRIPKKA
jgi:hypothetical protein